MKLIKRKFNSAKISIDAWVDGICNDLEELGYIYDRNEIKRFYKKKKNKGEYIPGVTIKNELESLTKNYIVKHSFKKLLNNKKKRCSYLTFELNKNKHLILLNGSMLELSYKECEELSDKRKNQDYYFELLLEDLNLQLFYEERKLQEIIERVGLLNNRKELLKEIIELKESTNELIDSFIEDFNRITDLSSGIYKYELEASNLLNEKKYSDDEINSDKEDLETSSVEADEMISSNEKEIKIVELLKEQIEKVKEIDELSINAEGYVKKQSKKI